MRIKAVFLILGIYFNVQCIAQTGDTILAVVHYSFSNITDTLHRDRVYTQDMILLLGKNLSVFKSHDKEVEDSFIKASMNQSLNTGMIDLRNRKKTTSTEYYKDLLVNRLTTKQKLLSNYLIEDSIPNLKWDITSEVKSISGISCQKGIAKFKGRVYEAWFTTKFPFNNGPWKLGGLPGLIIEASDTKKEVVFAFGGLEVLSKHSLIIKLPKDGTKITASQFEKIKEAFRIDPVGFVNNSAPSNGITTRIQDSPNFTPKNPVNNPIELPDK